MPYTRPRAGEADLTEPLMATIHSAIDVHTHILPPGWENYGQRFGVADWPTLADGRLFENRDLAPTLDVRQVFKGILRDHFGIDARLLDTAVFPESGNARALDTLIA